MNKTYYISIAGKLDNTGEDKKSPLSFEYLTKKIDHAGDTFIVLDGIYPGHIESHIYSSDANNRLIIKSETWLGAKTTGDSGPGKILQAYGNNVDWIGFEIYDQPENGNRISNNGIGFNWSDGWHLYGANSRFIDCVAHDVLIGFSMWSTSIESSFEGLMAYNIGWNNELSDRNHKGHGHGYYVQNIEDNEAPIYKYIKNCVCWGTAAEGFHLYGQGGNIDDFYLESNASFNLIGYNQLKQKGRSFLLGGWTGADRLYFRGNISQGADISLGYTLGPYDQENDLFKGEARDVVFQANSLIDCKLQSKYVKNYTVFSSNRFKSGSTPLIFATRDTTGAKRVWTYPVNDNTFIHSSDVRIGVQPSRPEGGTDYYLMDEWGFENVTNELETIEESNLIVRSYKGHSKKCQVYIEKYTDDLDTEVTLPLIENSKIKIRDMQNLDKVLYEGNYTGIIDLSPYIGLTEIAQIKGNLPSDHATHTPSSFSTLLIEEIESTEDIPDNGESDGETEDDPTIPTDIDQKLSDLEERITSKLEEIKTDIFNKLDEITQSIKDHKINITIDDKS